MSPSDLMNPVHPLSPLNPISPLNPNNQGGTGYYYSNAPDDPRVAVAVIVLMILFLFGMIWWGRWIERH